jgi:hypothetical protein
MSDDPTFEAKFIAFLQLTFDQQWHAPSDDRLFHYEKRLLWHMAKMQALRDGAKLNILDVNYKMHRLQFRATTTVGIGNGVLYFNSLNVTHTKIEDAQAEYTTPAVKTDD